MARAIRRSALHVVSRAMTMEDAPKMRQILAGRKSGLYRYWRRASIPAHIAIDLARAGTETPTGNPVVDYLIHLHEVADA